MKDMVTPLDEIEDFLPPTPDKVVDIAKKAAISLVKNSPPKLLAGIIGAIDQNAEGFTDELALNIRRLKP